MMSFLTPSARVNDHMSTFFGYDNSEGYELKVKANRSKNIVIALTDADDVCFKFIFEDADKDTMHRFQILMTNIFNIYDTFSERFGAKQNKSKKPVDCGISSEQGDKLTVTAIPGVGVSLSITSKLQQKEVAGKMIDNITFLFLESDKDIFSRFRIEFTRLAAHISNMKLPAEQDEKVTKHV